MYALKIKNMRINIALFGIVGVLLASCTTSRYANSTEYDDVYYSSTDRTEVLAPEYSAPTYAARDDYEATRRGYSVDEYYDEDDFYFSRKIRRFHQPNYNSWRYFDPYFSNDLYFVMGTPAWGRWYNDFGWYDWTRPRFGASMSFTFGSPFYRGFANPYMSRWNTFNYYNPWVSSYYGFDPFFGYNAFGYDPYGFGGWGLGSPFGGYSYLYCPPTAYISSPVAYQRYNVARRVNTSSLNSQSQYTPRVSNSARTQGQRVNTDGRNVSGMQTRTASSNNYLRPKTEAEKNARVDAQTRRRVQDIRTQSVRDMNSRTRTLDPNADRYRRSSTIRTTTPSSSQSGRGISTPSNSRSNSVTRPQSRPSTINRPSSSQSRSISRPSSSPSMERSRPSMSPSRPSVSRPSSSPSSSGSSPSRRRPE